MPTQRRENINVCVLMDTLMSTVQQVSLPKIQLRNQCVQLK